MASTALQKNVLPGDIVDVIASEMACGVQRAVDCWMAQIEQALTDVHLTSLGRLNAVTDIVRRYKSLTGRTQLAERKDPVSHEF